MNVDQNDLNMIQKIINWADDHPNFDSGFVVSVKASLEKYGKLTPKQRSALQNIIDRWEINDDEYGSHRDPNTIADMPEDDVP